MTYALTCLQCIKAACVTVCPTAALQKDEHTGTVAHRASLCIGCRLCEATCPFGHMYFDTPSGMPLKCDLCGGATRPAPSTARTRHCSSNSAITAMTLTDDTGLVTVDLSACRQCAACEIICPNEVFCRRKGKHLEADEALPVAETALLSEPALLVDWNRTEEDEAWLHLQQDQ